MSALLDVVPVEQEIRWEKETDSSSPSVASQLAPALARLELGGDLSNTDRDLLDRLSPQNCLTFLICNDVWLHPDNLPLFDYSLIDSLVAQCGSAVMTHHYRPRPGISENYAIQTAIVNPGWEQPIVIGVFGPYVKAGDTARQERFDQLVSDVRTAYQIAAAAIRRIQNELARPEPILVVTPNDSKIITANSAAAKMLEVTPSELAGMTYEDIAHLLRGVTTLSRMESGPIDFSVIRVTPSTTEPKTTETHEPGDLRIAVQHMFSAIQELEELTRVSRDSISAGVINSIHNQAEVLRSRLTHLTGVSVND